METSKPGWGWQRTRGRCEPGQTNGLKILPELQAETIVGAPGTPPVIQASESVVGS